MAFHYKEDTNIQVDNIVSTILGNLKTIGSYSEPDVGYAVVRNPTSEFDIYLVLEATNKRYLQYEIGNWNAVSHSMDNAISFGQIIVDQAGALGGTELGYIRMSFDDEMVHVWLDYKGVANGRRSVASMGSMVAYAPSDLMVSGGCSLFRGTTTNPTNDSVNAGYSKVLYDVAGSPTKPTYIITSIASLQGWITGQPYGLFYAPKINKRYLVPKYLQSYSALSGGENAGIRGRLDLCYENANYDTETHGQTVEAADGKVFMLFIQDVVSTYHHYGTKMWIRMS